MSGDSASYQPQVDLHGSDTRNGLVLEGIIVTQVIARADMLRGDVRTLSR